MPPKINQFNFGFDRHNPKHLEKLKDVLSQYGPKRWRAASSLYLYLNPKSKMIDEETGKLVETIDARTTRRLAIEEAQKVRASLELAHNPMATSADKNSGRRWGLHMPVGELQFIELIDPDVLRGTPDERRKSLRDLTREFKEYAIYTKV